MNAPAIVLKLDGATIEEAERCRNIIHTLFAQGFFNLRNTTASIKFDNDANMREIEYDTVKWRSDKPPQVLQKRFDNVSIEVTK